MICNSAYGAGPPIPPPLHCPILGGLTGPSAPEAETGDAGDSVPVTSIPVLLLGTAAGAEGDAEHPHPEEYEAPPHNFRELRISEPVITLRMDLKRQSKHKTPP